MAARRERDSDPTGARDLTRVRHRWAFFAVAGVLLVILGILALGSMGIATLASVVVFGSLLMIAGVATVLTAFTAHGWGGFTLHVLFGILSAVVGFVLIISPIAGAVALTLFLAIYFLAGGLFRVVSAVSQQFAGWGWAAAAGVASVALGAILFTQWPEAALWFIGLLLGIELILQGFTWIALGFAARRLKQGYEAAGAHPTPSPA
jgi:uncharacterized membrane protein HdeD (DUF308 family)